MKKIFTLCAAVFMAATAFAEVGWEQIYSLPTSQALFVVDSTGTIVVSDFQTKLTGGIYYSDDKGKTWKKTKAKDHNYNKFVATDKYLFALGYGGYIARSEDAGHTWEVMSYRNAIKGIVADEDMDYTAVYGMTQVPSGRIYLADYAGGVIYSDDYCESWTHTNDDAFIEEEEGKEKGEVIKTHAVLYNIEWTGLKTSPIILAFGLYNIYSYDVKNDKWSVKRQDSNLLGVSCKHNNYLYAGRAMPNDSYEAAFLEKTKTGASWTRTGRPDTKDNNVRYIASNDSLLVVGLQSTGIYFSADHGATWEEISQETTPLRYPGVEDNDARLAPLGIGFDKEYIYVSFYDEDWRPGVYGTKPGVYRYPLAALNPTGIKDMDANSNVNSNKNDNAEGIYNLAGQKMQKMQKGFNIVNGKKVVF